MSSAPTPGGISSAPTLQPSSLHRKLGACTKGLGRVCVKPQSSVSKAADDFSYKLVVDEFLGEDVAFMAWIRMDNDRCSTGKSKAKDDEQRAVLRFDGSFGNYDYAFRLYATPKASGNKMLVRATFLSRSNVKQGQNLLAQKQISLETSCEARGILSGFHSTG